MSLAQGRARIQPPGSDVIYQIIRYFGRRGGIIVVTLDAETAHDIGNPIMYPVFGDLCV